jgi:hydroxypyruvate isomerase
MPRDRQHASIVEGLKRANDLAARSGVTLLIEVVNTLAPVEPLHPQENHLEFYLDHAREAFQIVDEVSSPHVKVLFDIYHVQIMEGNLIATIRNNIARIGHFHVGDVPGRHEPGTGEINYANVFQAIRDVAFRGFVAMEYVPSRDAMATLADVRRMV